MKTLIFITNLRGAKKIKILKALSQVSFPEQPVLLNDDSRDNENPDLALKRSVLRIQEVYLENRHVILALDRPVSAILSACGRFQIDRFVILDGELSGADIIQRTCQRLGGHASPLASHHYG